MAFHLYLSNSLEKLADGFYEKLCSPMKGEDPFAAVHTVVPNGGMATFLKRHLARKTKMGIAANLECPFLQKFIADQISCFFTAEQTENFQKSLRFWAPENLSWRIDALLAAEKEAFPELTAYWDSAESDGGSPDPVRRHLLSLELAQCFDRYQLYRSSSSGNRQLKEFREGKNQTPQARVYHRLCKIMPDPDSFYTAFFNEPSPRMPLPPRVGVFGISTMSALFLRCLKKISDHTELFLFCPSPCQEYHGDFQSRPELLKECRTSPDRAMEILEEGASHNQILADFGVAGREFFNLLLSEGCFSGEETEEILYCDPGTENNALKTFQSDILNARVRSEADAFVLSETDNSIRINCCTDARRELEVLHDQLLELFYGKSASCQDGKSFKVTEKLRMEDVIVMFPDINKAAPMIDAVFSAGPFKGKYAVCDRSTAGQSQVIECFTRLLELPKSRCTADEIIDLLEFGCLNSKLKLPVEDLPALTALAVRARISWGLDETEHSKFRQIPFKEFSWKDGIERLLTEYARCDDASVIYSDSETGGIDGSNAENLGILAQFVETLKEWRAQLHKPRTSPEWSTFFHEWIDTFFKGGDRAYLPEIAALRFAVNRIVRSAADTGEEIKIASSVFISRLKSEYALPGGKQPFLRDKITFCSLVPLRAVPAKVIAILGLNDGEFPGQSRHNSFDLMAAIQRNDPNLAQDGRYLFLEALMAAQENLILSYVGFDNGEELVPAIPLATVENVLRSAFKGFEKKKIPLKSLEQEGLKQHRLEKAASGFEKNAPEAFSLALPQVLSLKELQNFLTQNCKAFFKLRYGFDYTPYQKASLAKDDPEKLNDLDRSTLRKALLAMRLDDIPPEDRFSLVQRTRILPVNSKTIFDETQALIDELPEEAAEALKHQSSIHCEMTFPSTPVTLSALLPVPGSFDTRREILRYCVLCSKADPKKQLSFYLEQLLLTACYDSRKNISGKLFYVEGGAWHSYELPFIENARQQLENLMAIALRCYDDRRTVPLPLFENASYEYADKRKNASPDEGLVIPPSIIDKFNEDTERNKVIERFFSKDSFADEVFVREFSDLALQVYGEMAKHLQGDDQQ